MALTERRVMGHIGVLPDGTLELREDIIIERDGVEIARSIHRRTIGRDADVSLETPRIRSIRAAARTLPL